MHRLAVGELYNPRRTRWPEAAMLRFTADSHQLALFYPDPASREVHAVRKDPARFGWIPGEHIAVLAYRFGDAVPWSDATYTPHRDPQAAVPAGDDESPLLLEVVLVDATTGIVRALRALTWPPGFATIVRGTIAQLLSASFDAAAADGELGAIYKRHPSVQSLVDHADATCVGGAPHPQPHREPAPSGGDASGGPPEPRRIIDEQLGPYLVRGRTYHRPLPEDLRPWYCYTRDSGHCIAVAVAKPYQAGRDPADFLAACPVQAVLTAGWELRDGFIVVDLPYDEQLGLVIDESHEEF